jgi:hypothetical protein
LCVLSLSLSQKEQHVKSEKSVLFFHFFAAVCGVLRVTVEQDSVARVKLSSCWLGKASALIAFWSLGLFFLLQESGDGILWNCVSVESQSGVKGGGTELDFGRVGSLKTNSVLQERIWAQFW